MDKVDLKVFRAYRVLNDLLVQEHKAYKVYKVQLVLVVERRELLEHRDPLVFKEHRVLQVLVLKVFKVYREQMAVE